MRRRKHFIRKRAELLGHIQNTTSQYNLPPLGTLSRPHHRRDKDRGTFFRSGGPAYNPDRFGVDQSLRPNHKKTGQPDPVEGKEQDPMSLHLSKSIKGVGDVMGLTMFYEIHNIGCFPAGVG